MIAVDQLPYLVATLIGFLLGSIPTGYLVAKSKGIDIRSVGSGNIGATNAFRVLGKGPGIFVLLVDGLKGWTAAHYAGKWSLSLLNASANANVLGLMVIGGVTAILGHNFTPWLRFKGGKGIATTAGVLLAWSPSALAVTLAIWLVVFLYTHFVSLASIAAAIVLPFAVWSWERNIFLTGITSVLCALAIYKHKENIQRLLSGTENRISFGKKTASEVPK